VTKDEAIEYVQSCSEDEGPDSYDEAADIFKALFERPAEPDDGSQFDLWSAICDAVRVIESGSDSDDSPEERRADYEYDRQKDDDLEARHYPAED
jgi:hypothetical protein